MFIMHRIASKWMGVKFDLFQCNWATSIFGLHSSSWNEGLGKRETLSRWLVSLGYDGKPMPLIHLSFITTLSIMLKAISIQNPTREKESQTCHTFPALNLSSSTNVEITCRCFNNWDICGDCRYVHKLMHLLIISNMHKTLCEPGLNNIIK